MKITNNISGNNTLNDLIGDITFSELTINNNDIKNNMIESVDNGKLNYTSDVNFNNRNVSNINNLSIGNKITSPLIVENAVKNLFNVNVIDDVIQFKNNNAEGYATAQFTDNLNQHWYMGTGNSAAPIQFRGRNYILTSKPFDIFCNDLNVESDLIIKKASSPTLLFNEVDTTQLKIFHNTSTNINYIQSLNSNPLIIDYNETEKLRINNNGVLCSDLNVSTSLTLPNNSITSAMINNLDVAKINFNSNIDVNSRNITTTGSMQGEYFKGKSLVFSTVINESRLIEFYNHIVINASACKLGFRQIDINISNSGFCILTNNHTATSTITIDISALTIDRDIKLYKNDDPVVEVDKTVALVVDFTINKESITTLTYQVLTDTVVLYVKT